MEEEIKKIFSILEKEIFENYDPRNDSIVGDILSYNFYVKFGDMYLYKSHIKTMSDSGNKDHQSALNLKNILNHKKIKFTFDGGRRFTIDNSDLIESFGIKKRRKDKINKILDGLI